MAVDEIRVPADGLTRMLARIFAAAGGSDAEAGAIAGNLVAANLAGHDSHGVIRTQRYLYWQEQGILVFGKSVETVTDAPGFALLDGGHGFGQTIGPQAVAIGIDKARENGFALVGLRRAGHLGRIGAWAEMACAEGLVSIHFVNVANSILVAPFGGVERRMSTAPICIGVPNPDGDFLLDFATSQVAEGKVLVARNSGKHAPPTSLIGPDGTLSGDPDLLYGPAVAGVVDNPRSGPGALTPMGDHKGSGLALACELLAGALTGSGPAMGGSDRSHNGMLSIYLDPKLMDDGHGWAATVADYIAHIRATVPADAAEPVMVPGDPERKRRADRLANGLPLAPDVWVGLLDAGMSKGLDRGALATLAGM
jgi:uncharacterized oxidoreductase